MSRSVASRNDPVYPKLLKEEVGEFWGNEQSKGGNPRELSKRFAQHRVRDINIGIASGKPYLTESG